MENNKKKGINYLDVELASKINKPDGTPDFEANQILSITYAPMRWANDELHYGSPVVLMCDTRSEKEVISAFLEYASLDGIWNFIPVGFNLPFDWRVILARAKVNGLSVPPLEQMYSAKPSIDLKPIATIAYHFEFKGIGLDRITNKEGSGNDVIDLYAKKDFEGIRRYIDQEYHATMQALEVFMRRFPEIINDIKSKKR
jgi:hypothetical protein